jgi:hypothetical protein
VALHRWLGLLSDRRVFTAKDDPPSDSCAVGSNTLWDFFRDVPPPFRPDKRLVALTPAFKTHVVSSWG